ncbi:hypothetical protein N8J89_13405 [Crossiella sp. CA-258035]|uniref:hypothetical protein n=1 Tax=Crossiella sp. CA-258035 TaxID=2981138 RepID=UPI0024BC4C15|nr:hypothetical protein [Crossiella sp. CA-258035]WHT22014.1 hypothetical protein N8J89_13405 [Crossiella sp. CA-258035]
MRDTAAATRAISRVWPDARTVVDYSTPAEFEVHGRPPEGVEPPRSPWHVKVMWAVVAAFGLVLSVVTGALGGPDVSDRKTRVRGSGPDARAVGLGQAVQPVWLGGAGRKPFLAIGADRVAAFVVAYGEVRVRWEGEFESLAVRGTRKRPVLCLTFADSSSVEVPLTRAERARLG